MIARVLNVVVVCLACAVALPGCITINNAPIHRGWDQEQMAAHVQERFWFGMTDVEARATCDRLGMRAEFQDRRIAESALIERELAIRVYPPGVRFLGLFPDFNWGTLALGLEADSVRTAWYEPPRDYKAPAHTPDVRRGYPIALWERGS
ncbi:MAG: hypothetical protein RBS39_01050 [Phycisphaerales bacterium]|nr:hypothetical protein [Phycisphaerales bacterium]